MLRAARRPAMAVNRGRCTQMLVTVSLGVGLLYALW